MKKILLILLFAVLLSILGFALLSTAAYRRVRPYPDATVLIAPGAGARGALAQMRAAGIVPDPRLIALPLVASHQYSALKAGEYFFPAGLSPAQAIAMVAQGKVVVHQVTVPEGVTLFQVAAIFAAEPLLEGPLPPITEGSVFPNTVRFTRGDARSQVVAKLQRERTVKLAQAWANRDPSVPLATPEQAMVLASIVERETGVAAERPLVAGVFVNRLRQGMKLQSDPTALYGMEVRAGHALNRPPLAADMRVDTPYNTYLHEGLPPGPICTPGQPALEAVLHPAATDALYFVATGHGGHRFSATLDDHEQNVDAYRQAMAKPTPAAKVPSAKKHRRKH